MGSCLTPLQNDWNVRKSLVLTNRVRPNSIPSRFFKNDRRIGSELLLSIRQRGLAYQRLENYRANILELLNAAGLIF
jgi:hypothetical protein